MPNEAEALEYVRAHLGLVESQQGDAEVDVGPPGVRPDLVVKTPGGETWIVEIKRGRASFDAVGQLCYYRDAWVRRHGGPADRVHVVLAAKNVPVSVREALESVGGRVVELPPSLSMGAPDTSVPTGKTQVTTPQAWRVVYGLLSHGPTSIRQLSLRTGVSYGWAHRTVTSLEALGVAKRRAGQVVLDDVAKLLNGVAWERPFRSLRTTELETGFESVEQGARELTRALDRTDVPFAFTAHTAGALYSGYSFRADRFYLYASEPDLLPDLVGDGDGPLLEVYTPDRDLEDTEVREAIRLAPRSLVLLDLAGMGPAAKDLTRAMVESLA